MRKGVEAFPIPVLAAQDSGIPVVRSAGCSLRFRRFECFFSTLESVLMFSRYENG